MQVPIANQTDAFKGSPDPIQAKTKIASEKTGLIHKTCMEFMEASFEIEFQSCMCSETKSLLAESFYNAKYGSSIITEEDEWKITQI